MEFPQSYQSISTGRSSLENWLSKNYPEFKQYLDSNFPTADSYQCKLYMFYNNILEIPLCSCGKPTNFHGYKYGFSKWCGPTCAQNDEETRDKMKKTNIEKYGVDYSLKNQSIKEKSKQTKLERYGDANYNNVEKMKQTILERYGEDNIQKVKEYREKTEQTNIEKYGVSTCLITPESLQQKIERFKDNNPYFISYLDGVYTYSCSNPSCNKCNEKTYNTECFLHYQRLHKYNIEPCPKCTPIGSTVTNNKNTSIEKFIHSILDEHNISYQTNVRPFDKNKELDIYIPDKNIAIECNGVYWHNAESKPKHYHYDKFKMCKDNNVHLLTFWDDQIMSKPEIVKSILLSKLGIYDERIYARKCIIKTISQKEASNFLEINHLQGKINSKINIGLYYNNSLVSIMSFGKGRKCLNSKDEWELYRYCSKMGAQVIGGAGKLFKYFINTYNPQSIISFSSNDISIGDLYKKLGFEFSSNSISYWYIKNYKRYHRYKFRKSELVRMGYDSSKSESQIMTELKYMRIYDTGQSKWVYWNKI